MRMVWLPGAYHMAADFLTAGFAEAVRARRLALDLVFVDMELAHVGDRGALQRLRSDIVLPARSRAYRCGWAEYLSAGSSPWITPPRIPKNSTDCACLRPISATGY